MSGLSGLVSKEVVIVVNDHEFSVRGLTVCGLAKIASTFKSELVGLFEGTSDLDQMLIGSPLFVATVISHASGEPDQVDKAKELPAGVQLMALKEIWDLTVGEPEELGKLVRMVKSAMDKMAPLIKEPVAIPNGPKESAPQ